MLGYLDDQELKVKKADWLVARNFQIIVMVGLKIIVINCRPVVGGRWSVF
jgi:hypothetical protein